MAYTELFWMSAAGQEQTFTNHIVYDRKQTYT